MMMVDDPESERRTPVPIENSEFPINCDQVIVAIGQGPNSILTEESEIDTDVDGKILIDNKFRTSINKVFAGGDIIEGETTVIKAMGDGKKAATEIHEFLS